MKNKKTAVSRRSKNSSVRRRATLKSRRPAHKRFMLHPATVFMLLCVGVLLVGWTWKTAAADYKVHAKIPAPPLTEPAIITSQKDGDRFKSTPIEISGTCPDDSYVEIYRNGELGGVAICDNATNTFDPLIALVPGANVIAARVFNITDDEGPLSDLLTIYYDPPVIPAESISSSTSSPTPQKSNPTVQPLTVTSEYSYKAYLPHENVSWQLSVNGGVKPYALNVKWGDGRESNYASDGNSLEINHSYNAAGSYVIEVRSVDASGGSAFLQLAVIVKSEASALQLNNALQGPVSKISSSLRQWIWVVWPAYLVLMLMVVSFWLGERQQNIKFLTKKRPAKRR